MKIKLVTVLLFFFFFEMSSQGTTIKKSFENGKIIKRTAKNTLTPVLLNKGDKLEFTLRNGQIRTLQLLETNASIMRTNVKDFHEEYNLQRDGGTICEFTCKVLIDGHEMTMQRYLPTQESYYEPYVVNGMRIWFDAVKDYFNFFTLKHGWCEPRADTRFAVSDATDPVAPDLVEWYPIEIPFLDVNDSYLGDDVWMGPYLGVEPHGGMDVNTPKGTPLYTPFEISEKDDQWLEVGFEPKPYYWAATWIAKKNWPNGSEWTLTFLHLDKYLVEEHIPLKSGAFIAEAAGTGVGAEEHTHFEFMIRDEKVNTVDDKVMVLGNIISEMDSEYEIIVEKQKGKVPKSSALYIRRDDRPADFSIFMISEYLAKDNNFKYEIPQILLDPWYLQWQMFENYKENHKWIKSHFSSVEPTKAGTEVTFLSMNSRPGLNKKKLNYYWTFGDGGFSTEKNPTHVFASPGIYPVSLLVEDGEKKARFTQHITVDGEKTKTPVLSLDSPQENSFNRRKDFVLDVYGNSINRLPHILKFSGRKSNFQPKEKIIEIVNNGGGSLNKVKIDIQYQKGNNWASIGQLNKGNDQQLLVKVNSTGLSPGTYNAEVQISCENAVNSPQSFIISLDVILNMAGNKTIIVDNESKDFYATPYFWVGSKFKRWVDGYKNFYLTNGGRNYENEYVRFTPDLKKGSYNISFVDETPFPESKIKVLVHHAEGDSILWIEPTKSRFIGEFNFNEGRDGFVQLNAKGSEGEVLADAIKFVRNND
jgi:hypothetical protein